MTLLNTSKAATPQRETSNLLTSIFLLAGLACLIAAPLLFYPFLLMKIMCFAIFAAAFNLILGYCGLLSFGHAAFFGGAAYFCAHTTKMWGLSPELAILFSTIAAGCLGLVMGAIAQRRTGLYYTMVTLALAQLFYFYCMQSSWTQGENGIQSVPRGMLFGMIDLSDTRTMYYFVLVVFVLSLFVVWRIVNSPFGSILAAIKQNEQRTISLGYAVNRYKLTIFVISAALSGLAGSVKALVFQFATLTDVAWTMSGEVILMTLLGGIGFLAGPIVGASLVVILQNFLATSDIPITVVTGIVFMSCVMVFRRGIVGEIHASRLGRFVNKIEK